MSRGNLLLDSVSMGTDENTKKKIQQPALVFKLPAPTSNQISTLGVIHNDV